MVKLHHDRLGRTIIEATERGAVRKSTTEWEWDVSGDCEVPQAVELRSRPSANHRRFVRHVIIRRGTATSLTLLMHVQCRKCRNCLRRKANMWVARAMHEYREATRTWFATFTLRPEEHYRMQARGLARAEMRSLITTELSASDVAKLQTIETEKELTLFFKRVRKSTGNRSLRYLLVRENHKSGLPHFHALLHESGEVPIRYAVLERNWTLGHSKFKLCDDERSAYYVTKYLHKANEGRVRASLGYGRHQAPVKTPDGHRERKRTVNSTPGAATEREEENSQKGVATNSRLFS